MRKVLILFMAIVALTATSSAFAAKKSIMELPPYERAVLIIKHYETLHDSRLHWPYLGYGHRKLPGEKYFRGYKMSEREADMLLRQDLNKFIGIFNDLKPMDALLMGVLSYNIGPGTVKKSSVYRKLKAGDRNIFKAYTSHCHYKGKPHAGLRKRRITELAALYIP